MTIAIRPQELHEGVDPVPAVERALREEIMSACARTLHLHRMETSDVQRVSPHWRSGELAKVRNGEANYGNSRLLNLADAIGCKIRIQAHPADAHKLETDPCLAALHKALWITDDLCQSAIEDIGARSHPLTRVAVRAAGDMCVSAVEAIRYGREFWHREAGMFSAALFTAEQMLENLPSKSWRVSRCLRQLRATGELIEETAESIAAGRTIQ